MAASATDAGAALVRERPARLTGTPLGCLSSLPEQATAIPSADAPTPANHAARAKVCRDTPATLDSYPQVRRPDQFVAQGNGGIL